MMQCQTTRSSKQPDDCTHDPLPSSRLDQSIPRYSQCSQGKHVATYGAAMREAFDTKLASAKADALVREFPIV